MAQIGGEVNIQNGGRVNGLFQVRHGTRNKTKNAFIHSITMTDIIYGEAS